MQFFDHFGSQTFTTSEYPAAVREFLKKTRKSAKNENLYPVMQEELQKMQFFRTFSDSENTTVHNPRCWQELFGKCEKSKLDQKNHVSMGDSGDTSSI